MLQLQKTLIFFCVISLLQNFAAFPLALGDEEVTAPVVSGAPRGPGAEAEIARPNPFDIITNLPSDMTIWFKDTFTQDNIPSLLGVTGMTAVMTMGDYETFRAVNMPYNEHRIFKEFCDEGEFIGNGDFQIGLTALFLAAGTIDKNRRALRTAEQILEAIVSSGIVVQVLKHSTGRESPFSSTQRTGHWDVFPNQIQYQKDYQSHDAMPSGHLSTAMATFIAIEENYPEQKWIPWVGYPVMGWVAVGLVGKGVHWWSDFPIAAALGYSFGKIVTRNNYPKKESLAASPLVPQFMSSVSMDGEPMMTAKWNW